VANRIRPVGVVRYVIAPRKKLALTFVLFRQLPRNDETLDRRSFASFEILKNRIRSADDPATDYLNSYTVLIAVLLVNACDDSQSGVLDVVRPQNGIQQHMQDPCPTCRGIFLTSAAADHMQCMLVPNRDEDLDHIDDVCEYRVAEAFRPQLVFHPDENQESRETYWAVEQSKTKQMQLNVAYLLGYHDDSWHDGDSELIRRVLQLAGALPP
jgi:hypothetical protein